MSITFEYEFWISILLFALAIAFSLSFLYYLYKSDANNFTKLQRLVLFFLRFIGLVSILVLLMSPIIEKSIKIKQLPILAIAYDNSLSISDFSSEYDNLKNSIKDKFSDSFKIEFWSFGEKVQNSETYTGKDRKSDYSEVLKSMNDTYYNQNIGAVVLVGDGLFNYGQNPIDFTNNISYPIYSIGIGDTIKNSDAYVSNVKTNNTAFLKNKFPVEIEFKFIKLKNKIATYDIENNGKVIYSGSITVNSDDFFKLEVLNIEASNSGLQHYKLKIRDIIDETNLANNEYNFAIRIIENKQKILFISDGPHPDLGAIINSIEELQNYETNIVSANVSPDSISNYSLIIVNQLPTKLNNASSIFIKIAESRIPVLFLIGPNTISNQISSYNIGIEIDESENTEEVHGKINNNFSPFILSQQTKDLISTAPPLLSLFGSVKIVSQIDILANQKIRNIETTKPLISFGIYKGKKIGFILGEGIWRWRLYNYKENGNHEAFNELVQKSIQYLALKENEDNFNVYYQSIFKETEDLEFTAELFNDSFEPVNNSEITLTITNDSLREFNYVFDNYNDIYKLNAGTFLPGTYSFEAETNIGNQKYFEKGKFSVIKNELEIQNIPSNFNILFQLANQTGGKFESYNNYGMLLDEISINKKITIQNLRQSKQLELININLMFIIIVLVFGVEWFLRKFWGNY